MCVVEDMNPVSLAVLVDPKTLPPFNKPDDSLLEPALLMSCSCGQRRSVCVCSRQGVFPACVFRVHNKTFTACENPNKSGCSTECLRLVIIPLSPDTQHALRLGVQDRVSSQHVFSESTIEHLRLLGIPISPGARPSVYGL